MKKLIDVIRSIVLAMPTKVQLTNTESHRESRRIHYMREWSDEQGKQIFP